MATIIDDDLTGGETLHQRIELMKSCKIAFGYFSAFYFPPVFQGNFFYRHENFTYP